MHDQKATDALAAAFSAVLEALGVDRQDPLYQDSPMLAARAWRDELCRGLHSPPPALQTMPFTPTAEGLSMVGLAEIPCKSLCPHHLLPIVGRARVAYVPGGARLRAL